MVARFYFRRFVRYYKSKGLTRTICRSVQKLRESVFRSPQVLFYADLTKMIGEGFILPANFTIECYESEEGIPKQDHSVILDRVCEKVMRYHMKERFSKGASLWLVKVHGTLAGYIWTIKGTTVEPHFYPLMVDDVHFFNDLIFEEFRGRSINSVLINYVLSELKKKGLVRAFIETTLTNSSEIRSLAKTNFRKYGLAKKHFVWRYRHSTTWLETPPAWTNFGKLHIETQVFKSFDELLQMQQEWDNFVEAVGGEVFLTFDWCRVWWKYYGEKRKLRIFIFRHKGALVGIIPLFFETIWIGPIFVRVAKIVGTDFSIASVSIPIKKEVLEEVIQQLFSRLTVEYKLDVICLAPLAGIYNDFDDLKKVCRKSLHGSHTIHHKNTEVQMYFELADGWEKQLARLSKNERGNIRRNYNALRRASQGKSSSLVSFYASNDNFVDFFDEFLEMHQVHWREMGFLGHFGDWPHAREFHRELAEAQLMHNRLRLLRVEFNRQCLGYQYNYRFGNKFTHFLDARLVPSPLANVSLGRITFCELFKKALQENIRCINSLRGRYEHKLRLGGKLFPIKSLVISPQKRLMMRVMLFRVFVRLLDLCYYKMWYCRIAPKLPFKFKRRALRKIWVRSHMFA